MTAARVLISRNMPCGRQINRIKRDLFGSANPVETNRIFNEELEKHHERAVKKWGFDFAAGCPIAANTQFIWERVGFQESSYAPEMYTLTRAAHVRPNDNASDVSDMDLLMDERAERENYASNTSASTDTESNYDSQDESLVVFKMPANRINVATSTSVCTLALRKRQPKITEYMKERKRLAQTPKKLSPAKRMRTNSSGSYNGSSNAASASSSISTHFSNAFKRQRQQ